MSENQDGSRIINNEVFLDYEPWGWIFLHLQKLYPLKNYFPGNFKYQDWTVASAFEMSCISFSQLLQTSNATCIGSNLFFPGMMPDVLNLDIIRGSYTTVSVESYTKYIIFPWRLGNYVKYFPAQLKFSSCIELLQSKTCSYIGGKKKKKVHICICPSHTSIYFFPFKFPKEGLCLQQGQQHQNHSERCPVCTWQLPELANMQSLQAIYFSV